jgi:hypothetical protein
MGGESRDEHPFLIVEVSMWQRGILMIQALGDYDAALEMVERYGTVHPAMAAAIESLTDLPVDVDPFYPLEGLQ